MVELIIYIESLFCQSHYECVSISILKEISKSVIDVKTYVGEEVNGLLRELEKVMFPDEFECIVEAWVKDGEYKREGLSEDEMKKVLRDLLGFEREHKKFWDKHHITCPKCGDQLLVYRDEWEDCVCCSCGYEMREKELLERCRWTIQEDLGEIGKYISESLKKQIKEWAKFEKSFVSVLRARTHKGTPLAVVPLTEAEIIEDLKRDKHLKKNEVLVKVPKTLNILGAKDKFLMLMFSLDKPITGKQLVSVLGVTRGRVSMITKQFEGSLIKVNLISNPHRPSPKDWRTMKTYQMPADAKEQFVKAFGDPEIIYKEVSPLVKTFPELPWRKEVLGFMGLEKSL